MSSPGEPSSIAFATTDNVAAATPTSTTSRTLNSKTDINETLDSLQEPLLPPEIHPVSVDADVEPIPAALPVGDTASGADATVPFVGVVIDESGWERGESQPKKYRDWLWGLLFLLQFAAVATVAAMGIRDAIKHGSEWLPTYDDDNSPNARDNDDNNIDRETLWFVLILVGSTIAVAFILLNLLLGAFAPMLIQISLILSPITFFVTFVGSLLTLNVPIAFFSLIMAVFGTCFAISAWKKVPFATANLNVALAAIGDNHGLWILAYAFTIKSYVWVFLWCGAVVELTVFNLGGVYDCKGSSDDDPTADACFVTTGGKFIGLGMLLSYFWTIQVVQNIFHTTIAGVVGTWWYDPVEARSPSALGNAGILGGCCGCSPAIYDSCIRSTFHSFGSICFGSLLVGLLQVLQFIVRFGRRQQDERRSQRGIEGADLLFCLLQYIVDSLERLLEYFNTWAFVYVGLYGYDYWSAGKQVSALFKARGWSVIINDQLIARSLAIMSILIGVVTGFVGVLLGFFMLGPLGAVPAFFFGALLGGASCQILFGVITSAVTTVFVCFAESPNQLRNRHHDPELFPSLIEAWRKAHPEECGF
mmetsp:Transcript_16164/g.33201  ORF Transcript_16164/g.33201 Transcript_16164/m.33201 type:complete len:590 (+) Transcript_16164:157-1926(+)|eukprot:CAMPEP_0201123530 /NCGR_PEP_ID=MMETSP0850-20130426/7430_1 /ASSEMBLY_ACC=CAM_ASM_000622 /TAXON_ID=183588 /ORGANISM="Pseudo-nitzschia fraudulenta, Strain WWA7" /LENGTH=589 /DNA_ID=CAMNT_0047390501 /DNA_START=130 /DNA_END=1899 /DNA_ORIENTATION=-